MKKILFALMVFGSFGCSEVDLLDVANNDRLLVLSDIYDCRSQNRVPWGDSPDSQVITYLFDIDNKRGIQHTGYYKETILESVFDYKLNVIKSDDHEYEQVFFDIDNINETSTFLRFTTFTKGGENSSFVIDKLNKSLSPVVKKNKALKEIISNMAELGFSEKWVLKNNGLLWENKCIKI